MLVLLYYLSQNPDFTESAKPLMEKLKDSQQMLSFLNDLSHFTQTFSTINTTPPKNNCATEHATNPSEQNPKPNPEEKENPPSPSAGIADEFIQNILDSYLKKH